MVIVTRLDLKMGEKRGEYRKKRGQFKKNSHFPKVEKKKCLRNCTDFEDNCYWRLH